MVVLNIRLFCVRIILVVPSTLRVVEALFVEKSKKNFRFFFSLRFRRLVV